MTTTFRMNNSTELVRKHKNEYLKASKLEFAFSSLVRNMKIDKSKPKVVFIKE